MEFDENYLTISKGAFSVLSIEGLKKEFSFIIKVVGGQRSYEDFLRNDY